MLRASFLLLMLASVQPQFDNPMFIDVTGSLVKGQEMKEGRFLINPDYISLLGVNGTKANFYMADGSIIYSDTNFTEVIKKIDDAKLFS